MVSMGVLFVSKLATQHIQRTQHNITFSSVSLFGGASSEVRRCNCSVVV